MAEVKAAVEVASVKMGNVAPRTFEVPFRLGDKVLMDRAQDIVAVVTAVSWRQTYPEVEISWVHNGELRYAWIAPWRLTAHSH